MNSMEWYVGKAIKRSVEETREPRVMHWLVAAVLQANEDGVTFEEMIRMLNEINDFQLEPRSNEVNLKELGF